MPPSFKKHFQLIVFQKLLDCKLEKSYTKKVYMSPRPPPKISLKHEWKRELGSEVARQLEGEVARQANFFQPTQPTPNPIRDGSVRLDNMQDGRNTSRSQEINVNSFCEELSFFGQNGATC